MPSMLERMAGIPSSQLLYLFIGFIFICGLLKVLQLSWRKKKLLRTFKHFPGPPSHWFFGNSRQVIRGNELNKIMEWAGKYPYAYPRWFGGFAAALIVNHPDYAKTIFGRGDPKSMTTYRFFLPWIGKGLLVLDGPKWFQHRRLLTPGFHYDILKPYIAQIADSTKVMLDKWEKLVAKDNMVSVEIFEHVSLMTLDSIMKCAFTSQSSNQACRELDHYIKAVYDLTYLMSQRIRSIIYRNDLIYPFTSAGRHFMKACRLAHKYTEKVIEERRKSFREEGELKKFQKRRYLDFLDILLSAKVNSCDQ